MGLLDEVREIFGADNLYEVFGIEKTATAEEIKKAYRKKSLLCHPDKVAPEKKEEATKKFQTLCKSYDFLQDEERRKVYDETGEVDDESVDSNRDWDTYWRNLFPRVTKKQIDNFMQAYIGSEDEKEDLKRVYEKCEGDMNKICEYHVGYSNFDDEERLSSLLNEMIAAEEIENYPAFSKESAASKRKRRQRFEKEALEAAKNEAKSGDGNGQNDLSLLILRNQQKRASDSEKFIADLEAKYAPKTKRRPRAKK